MTRLDAIWEQLFPAEQTSIVKLLVEKVIVSSCDLEVRLRANGIERLVLEMNPKPITLFELAVDPPTLWEEQLELVGFALFNKLV